MQPPGQTDIYYDDGGHRMLGSTLVRDPKFAGRVGAEIRSLNWLPVEGADFSVRFERAEANGVVVEAEVFYAPRR